MLQFEVGRPVQNFKLDENRWFIYYNSYVYLLFETSECRLKLMVSEHVDVEILITYLTNMQMVYLASSSTV